MNAPTGTKRDGAEIGLAPEANGFMEGREPGPERGGREKSFKGFACANILNSTYQSFLGTEESELPPFPVVLLPPPHLPPTTMPPACPHRQPHTLPLPASEQSSVSQRVTLLIPGDAPLTSASLTSATPFHQAPVKPFWFCSSWVQPRPHGGGGGGPFLSQGQDSVPANGHCGFDSPVTGQLGPNFPRAANPSPRCLANITDQGSLPSCSLHAVLSIKLSAH